jgi:DNA topoisomerase II
VDYIRRKIDGSADLPIIRPYAKGFTGVIEPNPDGTGFTTYGRATAKTDKSVLIDELPLRCWTNRYKLQLLSMRDKGQISGFVENHTTSEVSFTITMSSTRLRKMKMAKGGLEGAFKLKSTMLNSNMHAFDIHGAIQRYKSAETIADAFFPVRLALYEDRKSVLESEAAYQAMTLRNKARYETQWTNDRTKLVNSLDKIH